MNDYYNRAQMGLRQLMSAVHGLLEDNPDGLTATEVGQKLGINMEILAEAAGGHARYFPWVLLMFMSLENTIERDEQKKWKLK